LPGKISERNISKRIVFVRPDSREQPIHGANRSGTPHLSGRGESMKMSLKAILLSVASAALVLPAAAQSATTNPATSTPVIKQRKINQQRRIANGVKTGQLTPKETAHLEHREAHINRETRRMKAANGGTLTPAEKAKITRQQNRTSRAIYHQKHDAQHR
jgi:hypothetical protein